MAIASTSVFVGRQSELRALHDAYGKASAGHSQVLLVQGEAGIGKTTLVERFLSKLPEMRILRASGDESETHVPFAMADQLLRNDGRGSDALQSGRHVAAGLELQELISSGADQAPFVVVVDDAHLIDAESLRALLFAARRLLASSALVLLVVRGTTENTLPEGWRKIAAGSTGGVLSLGPLAPSHISELALALGVAVTPDAAGRLWEHTRGSPLYAHAVLRELPDDESWQHEPRPLPVPKSYAQLVRQDLDRCTSDVVTLVEAAAVLIAADIRGASRQSRWGASAKRRSLPVDPVRSMSSTVTLTRGRATPTSVRALTSSRERAFVSSCADVRTAMSAPAGVWRTWYSSI